MKSMVNKMSVNQILAISEHSFKISLFLQGLSDSLWRYIEFDLTSKMNSLAQNWSVNQITAKSEHF